MAKELLSSLLLNCRISPTRLGPPFPMKGLGRGIWLLMEFILLCLFFKVNIILFRNEYFFYVAIHNKYFDMLSCFCAHITVAGKDFALCVRFDNFFELLAVHFPKHLAHFFLQFSSLRMTS